MRRIWHWGAALALVVGLGGCDEETSDARPLDGSVGGPGGAGGEGGAGGGGAGGGEAMESEAFVVTELRISEPGPPVGVLLRNLINQNINDEAIIIMVRFSGGSPATIAEAGAARYLAGQDTPSLEDDVFTWETAGTCIDPDDTQYACSVDVSTAELVFAGDDFVIERTTLDIYSSDLAAIIRLKDVNVQGTLEPAGANLTASLAGVITQADAQNTRFELPPGSGSFTTLDRVLSDANVMPSASYTNPAGEAEPAYALAGGIDGSVVRFRAE